MNKRFSLLVFLYLLLRSYTALFAIDEEDYAECTAIKADVERLSCFDNLAKTLDFDQVNPIPTTGVGKWHISEDINPVDDSKTVALILVADSGEGPWGESLYLVMRCQSAQTNLLINWNTFISTESEYVLTRVGKDEAVTKKWRVSTDYQATFHPAPVAFIKEILTSNKLVVQVTPYGENTVTAIFDTTGLENAIKPLRETCSW